LPPTADCPASPRSRSGATARWRHIGPSSRASLICSSAIRQAPRSVRLTWFVFPRLLALAARACGEFNAGGTRGRTACYTWPMLRRVVPPALLLALGLVSGVLVARLPPDLETTVVTRRHHGADPLLSAVLLRFGVDSLLHHPSRYFQPPILFPDPNPLRGTEPLVAEALLAVPFRLALGDRPAAVYTSVKIVTLALLTLGTGLMLKELGVGLGLCLLGGGLSVLVSTTAVFADRLQAVSLQWLPLSVLFAVRFWRRGRPPPGSCCSPSHC